MQEVITTTTTTDDGTTTTTETLNYSYDASGTPFSVSYNGTVYYYATNIQGDITAILNTSGTAVVTYTYDAWGNILTSTGSLASTLGTANPLRYRGYVYDSETGLYYLQSRYYNPNWSRFINADAFVSTGQGLLGYNMFAYCNNDPSNMSDPSGHWLKLPPETIDYIVNAVETIIISIVTYNAKTSPRSLPPEADPNSSRVLSNPDGTPKQKRWYGPDGKAERDRDFNHGGSYPFPHDHEWKNGKRGENHLPPSPENKFSEDPVVGMGLVTLFVIETIAAIGGVSMLFF